MKEVIIKNQKQLDAIKLDFDGRILIRDTEEWLAINKNYTKAEIYISGSATIRYVSDNATIKYVSDNATIRSVYGNATIEYVSDNATIKHVYGNATILLYGLACICFLYSAKKITAKGINLIRQIGTEKIDLDLGEDVNFIQQKETFTDNPTFDLFKKMYPISFTKTKATMYKAVHKKNDEYFSNYNNDFEYKIGKIITEKCDDKNNNSCSTGIHLCHKQWALDFGKDWDDMALLEAETDIKDIIVSKDCDGKVRTSKIKVLREVPKDEYYN